MPPKSRQATVQFADINAPTGIQASSAAFLKDCHQSAASRFRSRGAPHPECWTVEHPVPPKTGDSGSTGLIVAHLSPEVSLAWQAQQSGTLEEKRAHVEAQVHLALSDLADQDMHGYLAFTDEQRAIYSPDLVQLMTESLDRTTFAQLGRGADPHWEGTLVERVRPPFLVLVVSIGFVARAPGGVGNAPAPPKRRNLYS